MTSEENIDNMNESQSSDKKIWAYHSIEDKILSVALTRDKVFFLTIKDHIRKEDFSNRDAAYIFSILRRFYDNHSFVPSQDIMLAGVRKIFATKNDPESLIKLESLIEKIYDPSYVTQAEAEWIINEIDTYIRHNKLKDAILKSVDLIKNGDYDTIQKSIVEAVRFSSKPETVSDIFEDIDKRYVRIIDPSNVASTQLNTLNIHTEGGFHRGEISIIAAASGYGKSAFLTNLAVWYLKHDFNVLYLTFELSKEHIQMRMDKALWGLGSEDIKRNWASIKEKYKLLRQNTKGNLFVVENPQYSFTKADLERLLENMKNYQDFVPDIILVDYLELMQTSAAFHGGKYGIRENERQKIITSDLRNIAVERNIVMITATQTNRNVFKIDKQDEQINEQEAIGESIDKARIADIFLMILQTKEEREKDEARLRIVKNRHGPINIDIKMVVDFDKMRFEEKIIT